MVLYENNNTRYGKSPFYAPCELLAGRIFFYKILRIACKNRGIGIIYDT